MQRTKIEATKKKERRVLFIKSRNLTLAQSEILYIESRAKKVEIHTGVIEPDWLLDVHR